MPYMSDAADFNPADLPDYPPQDENGVDLNQIECCLALTPAERFEQHYRFRLFAQTVREAGQKFYGSTITDPEETE
jgi:hypothetical protein